MINAIKDKYIIITSIFSPTEAVREFSKFSDWSVKENLMSIYNALKKSRNFH